MLTKMRASRKVEDKTELKKPIKINMEKLGFEIIAGGPINVRDEGPDFSHLEIALDAVLKYEPKKDLLVYVKYFPEKNGYRFTVYEETEASATRPPGLREIVEKVVPPKRK